MVAAVVKPGQRHGNDGQRDGNAAGGHGKAPAHIWLEDMNESSRVFTKNVTRILSEF